MFLEHWRSSTCPAAEDRKGLFFASQDTIFTTPACKHSACLDSMLLYEMQGSDVSMHAMLEYMQQAGITYEMPAPYKLACTHWRETHQHCQAGVDSPSSAHWSREAHRRRAFLLVCKIYAKIIDPKPTVVSQSRNPYIIVSDNSCRERALTTSAFNLNRQWYLTHHAPCSVLHNTINKLHVLVQSHSYPLHV